MKIPYFDLLSSPGGLEVALGIGLVLFAIAYVFYTFLVEVSPPAKEWIGRRTGMADAGQSKAVRAYALRLASRKRSVRLTAIERLGDLNDRTAVPALLRCVKRYRNDGPFLEAVVRLLGNLGDERALPILRELSHGRHIRLMEEARAAVAAIEPRTTLLRPSASARANAGDHLLRPAHSSENSGPEILLRPSSD